jgi:hypothetical protein
MEQVEKFIRKKYLWINIKNVYFSHNSIILDLQSGNDRMVFVNIDVYREDCCRRVILCMNNSAYNLYTNRNLYTNLNLSTIETIKQHSSYKEEHKDIILYFMNEMKIIEFIKYFMNIYKLVHETDYLISLPKAYTFLICNKKNKLFPRGVDKIIINKLLFY